MFSMNLSSRIRALYIFSTLLSVIVLALSLLDLGFGSLFLGVVGPLVVLVHHGCTAIYLRDRVTRTVRLVTSTRSILTVGLLASVWLAGSIFVTAWGIFYLDGKAQMVVQVVRTPATVVAQGAVGLLESLVLVFIFVILIQTRRGAYEGSSFEDKTGESVVTMPVPSATTLVSQNV